MATNSMLREWCIPAVLEQIPQKTMWGDLNITCVDIVSEFIAIGTNAGIVYWYNRAKRTHQKLTFENSYASITSVCVVSSVEYMLAAGNKEGIITIYQIPKIHSAPLPDTAMNTQQIERFTVSGVHKSLVTVLEWSMNGMMLFSGDETGVVAKTELDFSMHISKSSELLNETHEVVQLSYLQQHLLVSTVFRTIICKTSNRPELTQIGSTDRKSSAKLGATMSRSSTGQPLTVYASRPGFRMWKANDTGKVLETHMYKDAVSVPHYSIPILNPVTHKSQKADTDQQFGPVKIFSDNLLVTYSDRILYILDPQNVSVVASCTEFRQIQSIAVGVDEIFVLEGPRSLIRIGYSHDERDGKKFETPSSVSFTDLASKTGLKDLALKLKDTTAPLMRTGSKMATNLLDATTDSLRMWSAGDFESTVKVTEGKEVSKTPSTEPSPAEEVKADSPEHNHSENIWTTPNKVQIDVLNRIGQQEYEDVVYKPKKQRRNTKKRDLEVPSDSVSISSFKSNTSETSSSDRGDLNSQSLTDKYASTVINDMQFAILLDSNRSVSDTVIQSKEEKLVKLLGLETFLCDQVTVEPDSEQRQNEATDVNVDLPETENVPVEGTCAPYEKFYTNEAAESAVEQMAVEEEGRYLQTTQPVISTDTIIDSIFDNVGHVDLPPEGSSITSAISYGPPSGSSSVPDTGSLGLDPVCESPLPVVVEEMPLKSDDGWIYSNVPGQLAAAIANEDRVACVDIHSAVYFGNFVPLGFSWTKAKYPAKQMAMSPKTGIMWRVHRNVAFALVLDGDNERWTKVTDNVLSIGLDNRVGWIVKTDGTVAAQLGLTIAQPVASKTIPIACRHSLLQIVASGGIVWALTVDGTLLSRSNVTEYNLLGDEWEECPFHFPPIISIAFGPQDTGWLIDEHSNLYFLSATRDFPFGRDGKLWQVLISDYIFQSQGNTSNWRIRLSDALIPERLVSYLHSRKTPVVAASNKIVFFAAHSATVAHVNKTVVRGHHWENYHLEGIATSSKWAWVTSEGVYRTEGTLWIFGPSGDLFACETSTGSMMQVRLPNQESIMCMASAPETLWILTSKGQIYIRRNIELKHFAGSTWESLDLAQLYAVQLVHISCGNDIVWACDNHGTIYMRIGSLQPPSANDFTPAWVTVDGKPTIGTFFTKVYVGTRRHMVWALDNCRNIYVRQAIYPELLIGTDWILVSGIEAIQLTISETAVWALSPKGEIFRRYGISETNYIGDYWKKIPGTASVLTASLTDGLWAIGCDGQLIRHFEKVIGFNSDAESVSNIHEEEEDGWEILH